MTKEIHGRHRGHPSKSQNLRCGGLDRRHRHRFLVRKINIFRATKFGARWSIKAARICFREIGGTKNRGRALSGTCSWMRTVYAEFMKIRLRVTARQGGLGRSMEFMTKRRKQLLTLSSFEEERRQLSESWKVDGIYD